MQAMAVVLEGSEGNGSHCLRVRLCNVILSLLLVMCPVVGTDARYTVLFTAI
jgi:hypothetical protein